jgi:hypothetical protein
VIALTCYIARLRYGCEIIGRKKMGTRFKMGKSLVSLKPQRNDCLRTKGIKIYHNPLK